MTRDAGSEDSTPSETKKSLRVAWLKHLSGTSSLDVEELGLFEWYVKETEKVHEAMLTTAQAYIQEQIGSGVDCVNDSGLIAVDYHLKRVRYSHIIYLASLLETVLEGECGRLAAALQNIPFTITDLKGDQWSTKRKFLERYGHFEVPDEFWGDVKKLTTLRNCLVHDNGSTADLNSQDKAWLQKQPGLVVSGHDILIGAEYVSSAFGAVKALVQFIERRIGEVIERAVRPRPIS